MSSASGAPALEPLSNQVAGHAEGVQSLEAGRLVVKACLARELAFYRQVGHAAEPNRTTAAGSVAVGKRQTELLKRLLTLMPECHGSWTEYIGRQSAETDSTGKREDDEVRIVLENLTFGYAHPNVCDIKLGTQLWDEDATPEKQKRMQDAAATTTSGSHGIRLTGWQTYDAATGGFHRVAKAFGKTIGPEELALGMRMLLACPEPTDAERADAVLRGTSLCDTNAARRLPRLPDEVVASMLREHMLPDLEALHAIFGELEVRIRGASLLLVYEGDARSARDTRAKVRLIDFGHATLVPGEGPDQGVLLGLTTVLQLARQQLERLEA